MSKIRAAGSGRASRPGATSRSAATASGQATRETVESIAVAVILAFLFRAFVAEAFVIPTGSMAPTLMGQHKDVKCPECGYWYQAGASIEIVDDANAQQMYERGRARRRSLVVAATCPLCRYRQLLDVEGDANCATFSGDRILVSKFIYDFTSPKRWDVIVFKYPFNAKQNFIKRLIGLPGESIRIKHGDIYVKQKESDVFEIARKPDRKLLAMLQVIDDSDYIAPRLTQVGWPQRWQPWSEDAVDVAGQSSSEDDGGSFLLAGDPQRDIWLRYHHIVPTSADWDLIESLNKADKKLSEEEKYSGTLITDFYAYNAFTSIDSRSLSRFDPDGPPEAMPPSMFGSPSLSPFGTLGLHWVSDLACESKVDIQSATGELLLNLVKGGVDYRCRIDIASGVATLSIDDGAIEFVSATGESSSTPQGTTGIRGQGRYAIRFSNVDAELRLWIDEKRIEFDGPTTYEPDLATRPVATLADPGDLAPAGFGTRGAKIHFEQLRVSRDVYYVATNGLPPHEYRIPYGPERIQSILDDPNQWPQTPLFDSRNELEYDLADDEYFPMGDNSPQSSDARMWPENGFRQDMLIGRALLIYWPHPWYRPIPYMPNVKRMRLIH